ncbi:MAG: ABC transporter ATP-binding protein [Peptococcaceae bacterium]
MIIETHGLTKQFNSKGGCKDICLSVTEGQIFGFLGPNGAGKSTLVKTLLGLLIPNSGQASIMGKPLGNIAVRKKIGYLPELFRYHEWLSGAELLKFHAQLHGLGPGEYRGKIAEVLDIVGLTGKEKQKVGTYSKGMQQRIGLAVALINDPRLLFLDEPTSALDPIGRKEVRDILLELKSQRKTVFLNSHLLSEVETLCDELAVINQGQIVINGSWQDLQVDEIQLEITLQNYSPQLREALKLTVARLEENNTTILLSLRAEKDINKCLEIIIGNGGIITKVHTKRKSLEELFMFWVKKEGTADGDDH